MITERALAKINVNLHVTGKRPDGYHLLDSIVVFAEDCADTLILEKASRTHLTVSGTYADSISGSTDNLVIKALRWLEAYCQRSLPVAITLAKNIPVGAGLGGGSADAAALLRGVITLYAIQLDKALTLPRLAEIGADVPVCFEARAARLRGIGEHIIPLSHPPAGYALLINNGTMVPTASVFQALVLPDALPSHPATIADALQSGQNHLQTVAEQLHPTLRQLRATIETAVKQYCPDARLRMTGSGSTYGLYHDRPEALAAAADALKADNPSWWVVLTRLC